MTMSFSSRILLCDGALLLLLLLLLPLLCQLAALGDAAFVSYSTQRQRIHHAAFVTPSSSSSRSTSSCGTTRAVRSTKSTNLPMVFDFLSERSKEGLDQLQKLGTAASKGQLGQGLTDVAVYTQQTNQAFANGLAKSRMQLLDNLESLFTAGTSSSPLEDVLEDLADILLQADLGLSTAEDVVAEVKSLYETNRGSAGEKNNKRSSLSKEDLKSIMRGKLIEAFEFDGDSSSEDSSNSRRSSSSSVRFSTDPKIPTVLFIMGANGMGKTTTIGKLANRLRLEGNQTVLLAACDTFRAGAVEQLQQWADRAEVDLVGPDERVTTPSAVLYSALDKALAENYDTVLVDTSGRLSNNEPLTAELAKMIRVIQKRLSVETTTTTDNSNAQQPIPNTNVPHETLLVLDAAQGRMALDSAKVWNENIGLSGLILTKLDGSARGGSVVAISRDLQLPVKLIGVGEGIDDLRDFDPERFVDSLLGIGAAGGSGGKQQGIFGGGGGSGSGTAADQEGAMLAKRLETMRQERNARNVQANKAAKKQPIGAAAAAATPAAAPVPVATTSSSSSSAVMELTNTPNTNAAPSSKPGNNPRRKNKRKKRKKGKR